MCGFARDQLICVSSGQFRTGLVLSVRYQQSTRHSGPVVIHDRLQLLAVCGLLALALTACSSESTHLRALLADPMADYEAEGIMLIDAWEQAERPGFLGGKPIHAEVRRKYRIVDQSEAEQLLSEAVAFAEAEGWDLQPSRVSPDTLYIGAKELGPGDGRLSMALGPADPLNDPDGPRVLTILLDFGSVRFDQSTTTAPDS